MLKISQFLLKHQGKLLALACAYFIAAHALFLGFNSWDGFSYRVPPVVEFVQHGDFGGWKFTYLPAVHFSPFFELLHVPFLKIFGLAGLYLSFSLVLLPFSVIAVNLFIRELTGDRLWGMFGALAFMAIPFVNTQPFSGYIDFAVIGALAFYLYALLRSIRREQLTRGSFALLVVATLLFSMSRQQAPYMAALIAGATGLWQLGPWNENKLTRRWGWGRVFKRLLLVSLGFAIGVLPAALIHYHRYLTTGSPIYPYRFEAFGITLGSGMSLAETAKFAGLLAPDWNGMLVSFRHGWLWPPEWPLNFYDGRHLGVGFLFWIALFMVPFIDELVRRDAAFLLALFVGIAFAIQDFWLPRWSMTLILAMVLALGGAMAWFTTKGPRLISAALTLAVALHLGRPFYDAYSMIEKERWYIRSNLLGSPLFIEREVAPGVVDIYPDLDADLTIVQPISNAFMLPLYGDGLKNRVVGVLDPAQLDSSCSLPVAGAPGRVSLIVDQQRRLSDPAGPCEWQCEVVGAGGCLAGRLVPRATGAP